MAKGLNWRAGVLARERERLDRVLQNSWMLGEDAIESIVPGDEGRLAGLVDAPFDNPFAKKDQFDVENPAVHLLSLMRMPEFFPLTCDKVFNVQILPLQNCVLRELWYKPFPMLVGSRGFGKSFLLALYSMLKALIHQGTKIVIVGAAFRQAKVVFEYVEMIWANAPVLRDLCGGGKGRNNREQGPRRDIDRCECIIGESIIMALPLGDGKKIRGQRANIVIADEFACLGGETLVETDRGLMRLADSEKEMGSFRLNTGGGLETPSDFITTPPTDAYRVTTTGGYSFVCSAIHTVMTTRGWRIAQELTTGDYLPLENTYEFPAENVPGVDEGLAWLMGLLTAEGSINSRHAMQVHSTDRATVERVRSSLAGLMPDREVKIIDTPGYTDARGWVCKPSFTTYCSNLGLRDRLVDLGLGRATAEGKRVPWSILRSPRSVVLAYLGGLFDGDGSAFLWKDRGVPGHLGVAFYSVSEALAQEVQVLLAKLGLFSTRQKRASKLSDKPQWMLRLNGHDAHTLCRLLDVPRWTEVVAAARPPADRSEAGVVWDGGRGKWKAETRRDGRAVYLGRFASRDDALACVLANRGPRSLRVRSVEKLPGSHVLYDYRVPRAERFLAGCFPQHNSIPPDIYETVVAGFAAVSQDPVGNVKEEARVRVLKKLGKWDPGMESDSQNTGRENQAILSGTAYYAFNWFARYWERYRAIIESRGDPAKLAALSPDGVVDDTLNYRDYVVIRIPVDMLPPGFMAAKHVARSKMTVHSGIYLMEFSACFASDSDGFFKLSLIESCVAGGSDNRTGHTFSVSLKGQPGVTHVMGIDPAAESDNFAIKILALYPDHRRVVYGWTTRKKDYQRRQKVGLTREGTFYGFCARKIRDLLKLFPCDRIGMDAQGGGGGVLEALHDAAYILPGEVPIWEAKDPDPKKRKDTDGRPGLHLVEMVQFARADWTAEANTGMKKDMEDKVLLFPYMDAPLLGLSVEEDALNKRVYDTLEDATMEVEQLKTEMATIVLTQTPTGRERWDTPAVKGQGHGAGRLRKDRYSALVIANMLARQMARGPRPQDYASHGGWAGDLAAAGRERNTEPTYVLGEKWAVMPDDAPFGRTVRRGGV